MRIGMVGVNHKLADIKLREALAKTCERHFSPAKCLHLDHQFVLLSTCNRTEIYFCSDDLAAAHTYILHILRQNVIGDFDQKLYSYFGYDCFHHLARVTVGLDSAILAETEIQGQVKLAYENAANHTMLPYELHYLFQKGLKIGKTVRSQFILKPRSTKLEEAIFKTGKLLDECHEKKNVLFVGASSINAQILPFFKTKRFASLTICNRTSTSAKTLASKFQLHVLDWQDLHLWTQYDWVIVGTKAPFHLLKASAERIQTQLLIDLSVPRNIDPALTDVTSLYNIDQLNALLSHQQQDLVDTLDIAENVITNSVQRYVSLFGQKEKKRFTLSLAQPTLSSVG